MWINIFLACKFGCWMRGTWGPLTSATPQKKSLSPSLFDVILLYLTNYPQNKHIKRYVCQCMPMRSYCWYLLIGFSLVVIGEALLYQSPWTWLRSRSEKLSRIDEVNTPNLGLRKTKQETTPPQIISFHRKPQREKHKLSIAHRRVWDHRNTAN